MPVPAMAPPGIASRSTRFTKPVRARSSLGASARKKAGMPMVSEDSTVECRGRNGYGEWVKITRSASRTE